MPEIPSPVERRIDLPLIRSSDKKPLGTLSIIRTHMWQFYDDQGSYYPTPRRQDTLIFSITNAKGEPVSWDQIAIEDLLPDIESDQGRPT